MKGELFMKGVGEPCYVPYTVLPNLILLLKNLSYLRSWVNGKFQFGSLIEIHRESLHKHRCETRSSASSKGMKHQKSLKTCAVFCHLTNSVQSIVDNFFANSIVAASIIICSVFLSCDQLRRMEKFFVGSSSNFIWKLLTWKKICRVVLYKDLEIRYQKNEVARKKKNICRGLANIKSFWKC